MAKKHATLDVRGAEIGWAGSEGGRTVTFAFWDGTQKIGELRVTRAALWWKPAWGRKWGKRISVSKLPEIFGK